MIWRDIFMLFDMVARPIGRQYHVIKHRWTFGLELFELFERTIKQPAIVQKLKDEIIRHLNSIELHYASASLKTWRRKRSRESAVKKNKYHDAAAVPQLSAAYSSIF